MKKAWGQRAGRRYSDYISEVKDRYNKGQPRPIYVPQEMWAGLILYWQDPNTVKRSIIASKARRSEPDGPGTGMRTHLGGSTSVTEKSLRMVSVFLYATYIYILTYIFILINRQPREVYR